MNFLFETPVNKVINGEETSLTEHLYDSNGSSSTDQLSNNYIEDIESLIASKNRDKQQNGKTTNKDKAIPRESIHLERIQNTRSRGSYYFDDGKRRVDYVLVYNKGHNVKSEDSTAAEARNVFEVNIFFITIIYVMNSRQL